MESRRKFLKFAGISSLGGLVAFKAANAVANCDLGATPEQPLGPFYPKRFPLDSDVDLTRVKGRAANASGEVVIVSGIVSDEQCRPVEGAIVEIWQACVTGKYNHPSDTSNNSLDPNFQYYGMMKSNEKGAYSFRTIRPGSYQASVSWRRPPHIHFKISLRGYEELVTQMYFAGEALNSRDLILSDLHPEEQKKVVVEFKKENHLGEIIGKGTFDITLKALA